MPITRCKVCNKDLEYTLKPKLYCSGACKFKLYRSKVASNVAETSKVASKVTDKSVTDKPYITLTPDQVQDADNKFGMKGSIVTAYGNYIQFKHENPGDTFTPNWLHEYLHPTARYA